MLDAFLWWLSLLVLGVLTLPITIALLRNLPDRGYAFSRPLGLLLVSYVFWLLGMARIVPNDRLGVIVGVVVLTAAASIVLWRRRRQTLEFLRRRRGLVLTTEIVFALVFAFWAVVRSYTPEIVHTEQPMDFALMNGILQSAHFPPADPWFAGESISYYYFGYFMNAALTHFTGSLSSVTYNLALASTAAMAAVGVMSVVVNLVLTLPRRRKAAAPALEDPAGESEDDGPDPKRPLFRHALLIGGVGVLLLLFIGNLVGLLEFLRANGIGSRGFFDWVSVTGVTADSPSSTWYPTEFWWWFRSSRVINSFVGDAGVDFTISEFPFFSFLLGDLHPHVMSLPFVVMAIALGYNVMRSRSSPSLSWLRRRPAEVLAVVLALGSLGFLNSWDLPTFTALFLAALLVRAFQLKAQGVPIGFHSVVLLMLVIAVGAVVLYAPFYAVLDTQASGVLPVRRSMTRPLHFFIVWAPFLLLTLSMLGGLTWSAFRKSLGPGLLRLRPDPPERGPAPPPGAIRSTSLPWLRSPVCWAVLLPLVPFALWALVELGLGLSGTRKLLQPHHSGAITESLLSIGSRAWQLLPLFIILALALTLLFRRASRDRPHSSSVQFALLLIVFGFLLLMGAELFHISDFFGNRMNTVFKFYYQSWALLSVPAAFALYYWVAQPANGRLAKRAAIPLMAGGFAVVIAAAFVYVPAALYSKTDGFGPPPTLDGLRAAARRDPGEFEAVRWLGDRAPRGSVIVEASPGRDGRPIGDYDPSISRVSQRTGVPTIIGWPGHEHQWRGNPFDPIAERYRIVETIYRDGDSQQIRQALDSFDVTYVIVGGLERRTYGQEVAQRFAGFMDIAFSNDSVLIYGRRT